MFWPQDPRCWDPRCWDPRCWDPRCRDPRPNVLGSKTQRAGIQGAGTQGAGTQGAGTKTHLKSRFCAILTKFTPRCICRPSFSTVRTSSCGRGRGRKPPTCPIRPHKKTPSKSWHVTYSAFFYLIKGCQCLRRRCSCGFVGCINCR